jgi:protein O-GlcNAc transferase
MANDLAPAGLDAAFASAVRLHQSGQLDAAERGYRSILEQAPAHTPSLCNLGVILTKRGQIDEAIRCYSLALAFRPGFTDALYNLGNLHRKRGEEIEAIAQYRACVRADPNHGSAHYNLGTALAALGRFGDAEASFREVLRIEPKSKECTLRLGDLLLRTGRMDEGIRLFREYAADHPDDPRGAYNLGLAVASAGNAAEAVELQHGALKLKPDYPEAHNAMALALELLGRKDDALFHYEKAVQAKPDFPDAWSNFAVNLSEQGRCDEAIACLRHSLEFRPDAPAIHSNLLLLLNYSSNVPAEQIRDEHVAWGRRFTTPVQPRPLPHAPHDTERRLRIGYLSADFRQHTLAEFIGALFNRHDRERFEVYAYSNVLREDDTTAILRGLCDQWRSIRELSDLQAAELMIRDRIDILIDLGGHTAGNRLIVCAHRPATVQATLFGYPSTTGMEAIDLRITDGVSDPPGVTDSLYTESCLRLPEVPWVYIPPADAPALVPLPALSKKAFTFGCMNNPAKISDRCLGAWAKLIQSLPGTRLVLLAGQSQSAQKRLSERFMKAGILRDRIQLVRRMARPQYFAMYGEIDIALDPFPYNGGVTTGDALWMGVPTLTVAGENYASRQGVMQMLAVGLAEFVAESPEALIPLAKMWLGKRSELARLRETMRERLLASPLADAPRYVRALEASLRGEWARRCPGDESVLQPLAD